MNEKCVALIVYFFPYCFFLELNFSTSDAGVDLKIMLNFCNYFTCGFLNSIIFTLVLLGLNCVTKTVFA